MTCPFCGTPGAYQSLTTLECGNERCERYDLRARAARASRAASGKLLAIAMGDETLSTGRITSGGTVVPMADVAISRPRLPSGDAVFAGPAEPMKCPCCKGQAGRRHGDGWMSERCECGYSYVGEG